MEQVTPLALSCLFIYNPLFGPTDETEHEKLLFYFPSDVPMDQKLKHVGLSEAMVNFTRTFSPKKPCEVVHTLKKKYIFFNPEPNYWMVMHINLASAQRPGKDDSAPPRDYLDSEAQDSILETVIRQIYRTFKFFHSSMESIVQKFSIKVLRGKLDEFLRQYLSALNFDSIDLLNTLDGIHFLPLDKTVYLKIQSFINVTENTFFDITHTCFLYNYYLVWSGLEQEDLRPLYKYLTTGFYEGSVNPYFAEEAQSRKASTAVSNKKAARSGYLIGPEDPSDPDCPNNVLRVFVGTKNTPHNLVVYRFNEIIVVFLLEASDSSNSKMNDLTFFSKLENFLRPQLEELSDLISKQMLKNQKLNDNTYRFIYFNHMNLALKTTLANTKPALTKEILAVLTDMHEDFNKNPELLNEICTRTQSDNWVVGRRSDQREFYVILNKKDATLIDIHEEVKRLCSTHFNNIFID